MLAIIISQEADHTNDLSAKVEKLGHTVITLNDEEIDFAKIIACGPDMVFVDMLPVNADLHSFIVKLKQDLPRCSVVGLSSKTNISCYSEALDWGLCDILQLPACALRLRSLFAHITNRLAQASYKGTVVANAFFNADEKQLEMTKSRAIVALNQSTPILIEGSFGVGKATFAQVLANEFLTDTNPITFDGNSCFAKEFIALTKKAPSKAGVIIIRDIERMSAASSKAVLDYLNCYCTRALPIKLIVTANDRLMNFVGDNPITNALYNKLGTHPIWLAPLFERPNDTHKIADCFKNEMVAKLDYAPTNFDFAGNKPASIYVLKQQVLASFLADGPPQQYAAEPIVSTALGHIQKTNDTVFLNKEGKLLSLKDLEKAMLAYAIDHFEGKLGRIAEALDIGRTTLYRKLNNLGFHNAKP